MTVAFFISFFCFFISITSLLVYQKIGQKKKIIKCAFRNELEISFSFHFCLTFIGFSLSFSVHAKSSDFQYNRQGWICLFPPMISRILFHFQNYFS